MKVFKSESLVDYATYTFNYANYCVKENQADIPTIYEQGFLPYSNDLSLTKEVFYMARSLRVDLARFTPSSENRRVGRKIEDLHIQLEVLDYDSFEKNAAFKDFCFDYASKRFSNPITRERLNYILSNKSIKKLFYFHIDNKPVGYVIAISHNKTLHYWFAFFSLDYTEYSIGKWMMFSVINWAKEHEYQAVYLGTCYGRKSLYKVRDFKGIAFWDGNEWNQDVKLLKIKCKTDDDFKQDAFKQNPNNFLEY